MSKEISLTVQQLEKVLNGTGVSKRHFMAKLMNVKSEEYKEKRLEREN